MKTMKRIKRRMNLSRNERENKRIKMFTASIRSFARTYIKAAKLVGKSAKSISGFRFDFINIDKDPGQGKISIPNQQDK